MRKKAFPIILLLICWIFNIFECLFSDEIEISLKNIITFKSVIFTFIITILFILIMKKIVLYNGFSFFNRWNKTAFQRRNGYEKRIFDIYSNSYSFRLYADYFCHGGWMVFQWSNSDFYQDMAAFFPLLQPYVM